MKPLSAAVLPSIPEESRVWRRRSIQPALRLCKAFAQPINRTHVCLQLTLFCKYQSSARGSTAVSLGWKVQMFLVQLLTRRNDPSIVCTRRQSPPFSEKVAATVASAAHERAFDPAVYGRLA